MNVTYSKTIILSCVMLSIIVSGVSANVLSFTPASVQYSSIGETQTYNVVLDTATQSLSGFNITVSIDNANIAEITAVSFPSWASPKSTSITPASSVWCKAADLTGLSGTQNIILCSIIVRSKGTGNAHINFNDVKIDDIVGGRYNPTLGTASIIVSGTQIDTVGVFRAGTFYRNGATSIPYGLATDTPITGDWNGDSVTEVGVFRSGWFYLNGGDSLQYGMAGDKPIIGDWNGDRTIELGVFRAGTFYRNGATSIPYGLATDTPITGDWNGDSVTDVGVFRSGWFYLNGGTSLQYGMAGDRPVTGDWDGDGVTEVGIYRSGTFHLNGITNPIPYGISSDTPISGDWG